MGVHHGIQRHRREPWNKGKIVGQKAPFKLKDIWALRVRLHMDSRQVLDVLGCLRTSMDVLGHPWIIKWWSWGESNPRPKAFAGQIYTLSWLIWF